MFDNYLLSFTIHFARYLASICIFQNTAPVTYLFRISFGRAGTNCAAVDSQVQMTPIWGNGNVTVTLPAFEVANGITIDLVALRIEFQPDQLSAL